MTQITLDNIKPEVIKQLQILAKQNNHSLSDEINAILEQVTKQETSSKGYYPLRGKPIIIADDFDDAMPEMWDALGQ